MATEISRMTYSYTDAGNPWALICVLSDPANRDNWDLYYGPGQYDPNNYGTPGYRNDLIPDSDGDGVGDSCDPCPDDAANECYIMQPGDLVVSELLPNPDYVSDSWGEWFEWLGDQAAAVKHAGDPAHVRFRTT